MSAIKPKEKYGHFVLVNELILGKKPRVVVGDPDFISKKFWEVDLSKFIKGMSKEFDGEGKTIDLARLTRWFCIYLVSLNHV